MNVYIHDIKNDVRRLAIGYQAAGRLIGVSGTTVKNWSRKYPDGYLWNRFLIAFDVEIIKPKPRGSTIPGEKINRYNFTK